MRLLYSDVCKDNIVRDTLKQWFTDITGAYGYFKTTINGVIFDVDVDRHTTHAGNQYIVFRTWQNKIKLPFNQDIDITKFKNKLIKMAEEEKSRVKTMEYNQAYRERIYKKFNEINKNENIRLNINGNNQIELFGIYNKYYTAHFSPDSINEEIKEVKEHYINYNEEQEEILKIKAILETVK